MWTIHFFKADSDTESSAPGGIYYVTHAISFSLMLTAIYPKGKYTFPTCGMLLLSNRYASPSYHASNLCQAAPAPNRYPAPLSRCSCHIFFAHADWDISQRKMYIPQLSFIIIQHHRHISYHASNLNMCQAATGPHIPTPSIADEVVDRYPSTQPLLVTYLLFDTLTDCQRPQAHSSYLQMTGTVWMSWSSSNGSWSVLVSTGGQWVVLDYLPKSFALEHLTDRGARRVDEHVDTK